MKTEVWENIQRGRRAVKLTEEIAEKDNLERREAKALSPREQTDDGQTDS